jgi:uncharacterized protein with PIN domain
VAIPCPRCGREYDVTLFEFGRTLWCTCGSRVGIAPRVASQGAAAEKRFIADAMLGRLARWLRILGFDCAYESGIDDEALVRRALREGRIILSRDRSLPEDWWVPGIHRIGSQELREQLREIFRSFELAGAVRLFSRCAECNHPLQAALESDVSERVPPRALAAHAAFFECPSCRRVYWEGSHTRRIRQVLDEVLGGASAERQA